VKVHFESGPVTFKDFLIYIYVCVCVCTYVRMNVYMYAHI